MNQQDKMNNSTTNFWRQLPKPFFALAPMEAVTDVVFRHVVARAGAPDVFFTEFANATGWVHAGDKAIGGRLLKTDDEKPLVAQIWGGDPESMAKLAVHCRELGYDGIDINMGCPAKSAIKSGGAALIQKPDLAIEAIAAAKTAGLPVSVKTRLGYSKHEEWSEWLRLLLKQDIVALTVHLRSKKEMSKVPAHWELMADIKKLRDDIAPQTLLIGNGDVRDRCHGLELTQEYGIDGVMIGRGIFQNPFAFEHDVKEHSKQERFNLLRYQMDLFDRYEHELLRPFETLKRYFKIYVRDFDEAASLRAALMLTRTTDEARELLDNHEHILPVVETEALGYDEGMQKTIKALVLDSDGTLLDTRQLIFEGFKTVLRRHGLAHIANDQYIRQRLGKPTTETFEQIIAGHHTELSAKELAAELDKVQNETLEYIKPYPHTLELLEHWKAQGVKLCLFTSGYGFMIDRNFTAAGIPHVRDLFDAIITADDNLPHKPEPDAILELLRRVDVHPENAVVVGDHGYDIIAGKQAHVGLKVGILHGIGTQHELLNAGADFLCDNLKSLNRLMSFSTK